jgi:hypothetical protein
MPIVHTPFTGVACWKLKGLDKLEIYKRENTGIDQMLCECS